MAVYEVSRHGPKVVDQLHRHPEVSREVVEETLLILQESQCDPLSLNWSMPYQGECSQFLISSKGFDSSICDWKNEFSLLWEISPLSH